MCFQSGNSIRLVDSIALDPRQNSNARLSLRDMLGLRSNSRWTDCFRLVGRKILEIDNIYFFRANLSKNLGALRTCWTIRTKNFASLRRIVCQHGPLPIFALIRILTSILATNQLSDHIRRLASKSFWTRICDTCRVAKLRPSAQRISHCIVGAFCARICGGNATIILQKFKNKQPPKIKRAPRVCLNQECINVKLWNFSYSLALANFPVEHPYRHNAYANPHLVGIRLYIPTYGSIKILFKMFWAYFWNLYSIVDPEAIECKRNRQDNPN